jgi:hypothetical protein
MNPLIDPAFDPLMDLQILKQRLVDLEINFSQLVQAHNQQGALIKQIAQQNTELLEQMAWQKHFLQKHS